MKKTLFALICVALLSGCASQQLCADAAKSVAHANSMAEIAKWNAIQEIAKSGDVTAKVAALQAIQSHKTTESRVICRSF
jgi:uncharacterized protein YceK